MVLDPVKRLLGNYVLIASIIVTFFVSPWNSIDPVSLPKLMLLGILSCTALGLAISVTSFFKNKDNQYFLFLCVAFFGQLVLVLLLDEADFSFKFYGTSGRSTGFFAYACLLFILISSAVSASRELLKTYAKVLIGVGSVLALYGFFQESGNDFYRFVNAYESNVFGTFGNPNYQSAFMGIFSSVALTLIVFSGIKLLLKIPLTVLIFLAVLNMTWSSDQGYFNFVAGFVASSLVYLFSKKKKLASFGLLVSAMLGAIIVFMGIFNKGPLADFIFKSSLQARGFYWRTAFNMMIEKPLFGVGMDGYGEAFRASRPDWVAQSNPGLITDTAHSIPLDIGASGGFPLLFLYLGLIAFVVLSIYRTLKRQQEFDVVYAAIVAAWFAYQAQSFISINQLGLGVWGWSLGGLLIGYEINYREQISKSPDQKNKSIKSPKQLIPAASFLLATLGLFVGLAASLPPYVAANKYYKAIQSGDALVLQPSAYLKPYDKARFLYTVQILADNKLDDRAIAILRDASKIYPNSFELWNKWASIPSASPSDIATAKAQMKRLDPNNPNL